MLFQHSSEKIFSEFDNFWIHKNLRDVVEEKLQTIFNFKLTIRAIPLSLIL